MEENNFSKRIFIDIIIIILLLFLGVGLRYFHDRGWVFNGRSFFASLVDLFNANAVTENISNKESDKNIEVKAPVRLVFIPEKEKKTLFVTPPIIAPVPVIPVVTPKEAIVQPVALNLNATIEQLFVADYLGSAITMIYSGQNSLTAYARIISNANFYYQFYLVPHFDNSSKINIASGASDAGAHELKVSMPKVDTLTPGQYDLVVAIFDNGSMVNPPVAIRKESIGVIPPVQYPTYAPLSYPSPASTITVINNTISGNNGSNNNNATSVVMVLTLNISPSTGNIITVNPPDAIFRASAQTINEATGASVILTATPAFGQVFSSWSDGVTTNPRTITMNTAATLGANFIMNNNVAVSTTTPTVVSTTTPPIVPSSVQIINISGTPAVNNNGILMLRRGSVYAFSVAMPSINPFSGLVNYAVNFTQNNNNISYQMATGQSVFMSGGIFQTNLLTWASGQFWGGLTGDITTGAQATFQGIVQSGFSGTYSASTNFYAPFAFDKNNCTIISFNPGSGVSAPAIGQDFGVSKAIRRLFLLRDGLDGVCGSMASGVPTGTEPFFAKLQYSDNGISYLDAGLSVNLGYNDRILHIYDLPDNGAHRYWRFLDLSNGVHFLQINEIQMMAQEIIANVLNIPIGFYHGTINVTGTFGFQSIPFEVQVVD